nr:reverse transcriptase domain-containing protein [Vibrio metschnikovii]
MVQTAISQLLTPNLEPHFERCSFGYRPGRSYLQAVDQIKMFRDQGYHYVLDADIRQYFDEINRPMLMAQLADYLPCPVLMNALKRC